MRKKLALPSLALAAISLLAPASIPAQDQAPAKPWYESFKLGGLAFGDAYLVAGHHNPAIEDQSGFWLRRVYLTFDYAIDDNWSARLRFEANSPGDFVSNTKLDPFFKDAYLQYKSGAHDLYLGISPSPTFDLVEGFWGYRPVEKTPADLYRVGSSRDFGLAYRGRYSGGKVAVHAMFGNGSAEGAETNEGKKVMLSVAFRPTDSLVFELNGDFENRPLHTDRTTFQAFAGFRCKKGRGGLHYLTQDRDLPGGGTEGLDIASAFGVYDISEKFSLLARWDRSFDGNSEADRIPYLVLAKNFELDLMIVGLEYKLAKKISLIPNLEYVTYRDTGGNAAPDDDVFGRVTLSFQI